MTEINDRGHYVFGGMDTVDLAKQFSTPLYVMDEIRIRENCRKYTEAFNGFFPGKGMVLYASKAFSCKGIYPIIADEGMGADVVSGGELYTALSAGFPADRIYFHGNNKTEDEIKLAIDNDIRCFVADNYEELLRIDNLSGQAGKISNVSVRIKPGVEAHTHEFIMTGQIDSKFGVALETGEAHEFVEKAIKLQNVRFSGIHCHIGSQIFGTAPFIKAAAVMLDFIADIHDKHGYTISELNLGGGYGVRYTESDNPIDYNEYIEEIADIVNTTCKDRKIETPFILMEPGRSIVASSGITLYKVGSRKEIKDCRTYIAVDGGMTDNPRYALYRSDYEMLIANKAGCEKTDLVTVAGKCCESGDLLGKDVKLQKAEAGDILAVTVTGAYNYSMSGNYNRLPRPAVVLIRNGEPVLMVKRETYEDLIRNDADI